MRRLLRFVAWGLVILLGLTVVVVGVLLVWLHTDYGREFVRGRLERELQERVSGDVEIGRVEGSVLGDAVVQGVRVIGPAGEVAAEAEAVALDFDLLPLLSQSFRADAIRIRGLTIHDRGQLGALKRDTGEEPSDWGVQIDRLVVEDSSYIRSLDGEELRFEDVDLRSSVLRSPERARVVVQEASAVWDERDLPVALSGELSMLGGVVLATDVQIAAGASEVGSSTVVAIPAEQIVVGDISANLAAEDLRRYAELPGWKGPVRLEGVAGLGEGGTWRGLFSVATAGGTLALGGSYQGGAARVELSGQNLNPAAAHADAPAGRVDVSGQVQVEGLTPDARPPAPLLERLRGRAHVRLSGQLAESSAERVEIDAELEGGELDLRTRGAGANLPGETAVGSFTLRGQLEDLAPPAEGRAQLTARNVSISGRRFARLEAEGRLEDGERIEGQLSARGGPQGASLQTDVQVRLGDRTQVTVERTRLELGPTRWRGGGGVTIGPEGEIAVRDLKLTSPVGEVAISGRVARGGRRGRLRGRVSGLRLSALPHDLLGLPRLEGRVEATAEIDLARRQLEGQFMARDLVLRPGAPPIDVRGRIDRAGRGVTLDLRVAGGTLGQARLRARARVPPEPLSVASWRRLGRRALLEGRLELTDVDLGGVAALLFDAPEIAGELDGTVEVSGGLERLKADLEVEGLRRPPLERPIDVELFAESEAERTLLHVVVSLEDLGVATGEVAIGRGLGALLQRGRDAFAQADLRAELFVPGVRLEALSRAFELEPELAGLLFAEAELSGTFQSPRWRLSIRSDRLRAGPLSLERLELTGRGTDQRFEASLEARQEEGGALAARARGALDPEAPIRASLTADRFRLSTLSEPLSEIGGPDIAGLLSAKISVAGRLEEPDIEGWATVREGRLRLPTGPRSLRELEIDARIVREELEVKARARSGNGRVGLVAEAELEDLLPRSFEARVESRNLPMLVGGVQARVTTEMEVSGRRDPELWRAGIEIERGRVELPRPLERERLHDTGKPEDVIFVGRGAKREDVLKEAEPRGPWLRLGIKTENPIRVRGDGKIRGRVSADLVLTMVDSATVMEGSVVATDASIELFNRRYLMERGVVTFDGATPPNPALDIVLSHEFTEAVVTVAVRGRALDPDLELRSDPPTYSRAELFSFLVGGRPGGTGLERGAEEAGEVTGGAATLASSFLAGRVQSELQGALPLDVIRFGAGEEIGVSHVTVGKWLGEDLFVAYRRRFDSEEEQNANEATFEYYFDGRWILTGTVGDQGEGNADLLWVKRY